MDRSIQTLFLLLGRLEADLEPSLGNTADEFARELGKQIAVASSFHVVYAGVGNEPAAFAVGAIREELGRRGALERVTAYIPRARLESELGDDKSVADQGKLVVVPGVPEMRRRLLVEDSDLIIAVSGRRGGVHTLDIARRLGRPVVPIPLFGGEAQRRYDELLPLFRKLGGSRLLSAFQRLGGLELSPAEMAMATFDFVNLLLADAVAVARIYGGSPRPSPIPRMFIASSSESLPVAEAIKEELEGAIDVKIWSDGVLSPGQTIIDALVRASQQSEYASFVFSPDDIVRSGEEEHRSVRGNVVFELGLFVAALGLERTFVFTPKGSQRPSFPSDLLGLVVADYEPSTDAHPKPRVTEACSLVREAIRQIAEGNS